MQINLGEKIRKLRKESGYTQEQLAEALGVTTGAVYKWESGRATPELELLVDIAEFFETSVDALLDYGWEKSSMGQAAERLRQFYIDKQLEEGIRYAEKVLQKYPNSFQVVLKSADIYFLTMKPMHMARAVELYQKAIQLIDQNTDEMISMGSIQNRIASCYFYLDRMDDAIALLKKNNVDGMNNYQIGLLLSSEASKAQEALNYLSEALAYGYSQLYTICIGYTNAYRALGKPDKIADLILWLYETGKGLRDTTAVTWMDRSDVQLFTILAEMALLCENETEARNWLVKARDTALRFDANPEYRFGTGLKFYHGSQQATAYDNMGETAMAVIENYIADEVVDKKLRPIWEKICKQG